MTTEEIVRRFNELGGFGSKLADCWYAADSGNRHIIETAFAHLFRRFDPDFGSTPRTGRADWLLAYVVQQAMLSDLPISNHAVALAQAYLDELVPNQGQS